MFVRHIPTAMVYRWVSATPFESILDETRLIQTRRERDNFLSIWTGRQSGVWSDELTQAYEYIEYTPF